MKKMKKMNEKRKFNKKYIAFGIIGVFAMVLVSAAILAYFGVITGMAVVSQSVTLNDNECTTEDECTQTGAWEGYFVAGDSVSDCGNIVKNNANVPATIEFTTTCSPDCNGIDTNVYGVLELTRKDTTSWVATGSPIEIHYSIVGGTFSATGVPSGYTLIYYKDNVANANDAQRLTVLGDGAVVGGDIPMSDDWNAGPLANYCGNANGYDSYEHCRGAKLWAVPNGNIDGNGNLIWANPELFWFETDLVVYSTDNTITLPAGGGFDFCIDSDFAINLVPDIYTIETKILPVL